MIPSSFFFTGSKVSHSARHRRRRSACILITKWMKNSNEMSGRVKRTKVPPPPILLCRTDSSMVFRPAPFIPSGGEKVRSDQEVKTLMKIVRM